MPHRHLPIRASLLLAALVFTMPAWSADPVRKETVELTAGKTVHSVKGKIKGYAMVEYSITAPAGSRLSIQLNSANTSAYFNLSLDGADEALFVGSRDGNRYQGDIAAPGRYKVQVYLMRNAARKNQTAGYVLEIGATGT